MYMQYTNIKYTNVCHSLCLFEVTLLVQMCLCFRCAVINVVSTCLLSCVSVQCPEHCIMPAVGILVGSSASSMFLDVSKTQLLANNETRPHAQNSTWITSKSNEYNVCTSTLNNQWSLGHTTLPPNCHRHCYSVWLHISSKFLGAGETWIFKMIYCDVLSM